MSVSAQPACNELVTSVTNWMPSESENSSSVQRALNITDLIKNLYVTSSKINSLKNIENLCLSNDKFTVFSQSK